MVEVAGGEEIFHLIVSQLDAVLHQQRTNVDPVKPALFFAIAAELGTHGCQLRKEAARFAPGWRWLGCFWYIWCTNAPRPFGVVLSGSRTRNLTDFLD